MTAQDFLSFHDSHFSKPAVEHFGTTFIPSSSEGADGHLAHDDWAEEEEEDDLGYYDDGVKRTLTDEQIEIFRHSELEALRREKERASRSSASASNNDGAGESDNQNGGMLEQPMSSQVPTSFGSNSLKKNKKKGGKGRKFEPKPDLRKRTWDVVDAGLDTLDYD